MLRKLSVDGRLDGQTDRRPDGQGIDITATPQSSRGGKRAHNKLIQKVFFRLKSLEVPESEQGTQTMYYHTW